MLQDGGLWRRLVAALTGVWHCEGQESAWNVSSLCQRVLVRAHPCPSPTYLPSQGSQTVCAVCLFCQTVLLLPEAKAKVAFLAHKIHTPLYRLGDQYAHSPGLALTLLRILWCWRSMEVCGLPVILTAEI